MFNRKTRSHSDMFRDELTESYGHFKTAASHAPGGAAEMLTPAYDRTRGMASRRLKQGVAVIIPVYETMKDGARNARSAAEKRLSTDKHKKDRNVLPGLLALLAAGVALGALGALVVRRRRAAQEWDEFESPSLTDEPDDDVTTVGAAVVDTTGPQVDPMAERVDDEGRGPFSAFADENQTADDVVARAGDQHQNP